MVRNPSVSESNHKYLGGRLISKYAVPRSTTMSQSTIVASIPPSGIFNVPFHKNRFFRGRSDFLENLARYLLPSRKRQTLASCLVHGMPGMGKSQLALEYAYQNRKSYRCVFWIGSETLPGLALNFASIADLLSVSDQSMGPERKIEIAKKWLENTGKDGSIPSQSCVIKLRENVSR